MLAELLVRCCSPTLAGIKVANLFTCNFKYSENLIAEIANFNEELNPKGTYLQVLKTTEEYALIYIYRQSKLEELLQQKDLQNFLSGYGYSNFSIEAVLEVLKSNLKNSDFPHEIGIFLGYPLADVEAFIVNKGANYSHVGYWKVYHNEEESIALFEKFRQCTKILCKKFYQGTGILGLTVTL